MIRQYRTRLRYYGLYAALAVLFWLFNLKVLAWIFFALVILPVFIGALILIYKSLRK